MKLVRLATIPATIVSLLVLAQPASATVTANSGFYDHQVIEYQATAEVTSSAHAAQLISKGNIVFHIVGVDGKVPAVQTARLLATLPNDPTGGNVLNFIPTEIGYSGGAWNLQIFHWNPGGGKVVYALLLPHRQVAWAEAIASAPFLHETQSPHRSGQVNGEPHSRCKACRRARLHGRSPRRPQDRARSLTRCESRGCCLASGVG